MKHVSLEMFAVDAFCVSVSCAVCFMTVFSVFLSGLRNRFEEYPKLRELIRLKDELIQSKATPPMYLRADLKTFDLNELESKFDVVLIEPPLEEYHRMNGAVFDQHWTWEEVCIDIC